MKSPARDLEWDELPALELRLTRCRVWHFFERALTRFTLDPQEGFFDCNRAACPHRRREQAAIVACGRPSLPPVQPTASRSAEKSAEIIATIQRQKAHLFEWVIRRLDGRMFPSISAAVAGGRKST
jgi:hypothetical protein